jgi:hypothetical protein
VAPKEYQVVVGNDSVLQLYVPIVPIMVHAVASVAMTLTECPFLECLHDRGAFGQFRPDTRGAIKWCRGGSIPTVLKGTVKIPPVQTKCNIDAGLGVSSVVCTKSTLGQFPVIWGDFGRRFTRKS